MELLKSIIQFHRVFAIIEIIKLKKRDPIEVEKWLILMRV